MMAGTTFVARRGSQAIPNATVYDDRLSYAALGLLLVTLARPEQASKGYRALMGRGLGEKATRAALRELDDAGYRHTFRRREAGGIFKSYVVIAESPITPAEAEAELVENLGHRAADVAARSDQGKHGVSAGRTAPRSTVARSAVPRSRTASLRAKGSSVLRTKNPIEPTPTTTVRCPVHETHYAAGHVCSGCRADAIATKTQTQE